MPGLSERESSCESTPESTIRSIAFSVSPSSARGEPAPIASLASSTTLSAFDSVSGRPRAFRYSGSIMYVAVSSPVTSSVRFETAASPSFTSMTPRKSVGSRGVG